jgi:hypothetical protein
MACGVTSAGPSARHLELSPPARRRCTEIRRDRLCWRPCGFGASLLHWDVGAPAETFPLVRHDERAAVVKRHSPRFVGQAAKARRPLLLSPASERAAQPTEPARMCPLLCHPRAPLRTHRPTPVSTNVPSRGPMRLGSRATRPSGLRWAGRASSGQPAAGSRSIRRTCL